MGVYRTYFDKNNTIIKNSYVNTGRNPVSELYFGGTVSRFLFFCSFSELKKMIQDNQLILDGSVKHILKIKNTSNYDVTQLNEERKLFPSSNFKATSFDLELRPLNELWDEGNGYDFEENILSPAQDLDYTLSPSNWFYRTTTDKFSTPGASNTETLIARQHFDLGNEDLEMDITDFVNSILNDTVEEIITGTTTGSTTGITTGITTNYQGFCLKYTKEFENLSFNDNRLNILGLFTKHTQTFFEPYIETTFDDYIHDDRVNFYPNKNNNLFLYVNVGGELQNLDTLPTCKINNLFYPVKLKTKGMYYITLSGITSSSFTSYTEFNDIWSNLIINGIRQPDVKMRFIPKDYNEYFQIGFNTVDPIRYGISLSGIKREERILQGDVRRVNVHARKPFTVAQNDIIDNLYYRLYIRQGNNEVVVLDWQPISKTYNNNFFTLNTKWLIPQIYYVDIRIQAKGEINTYTEELKFTVVNQLK